MPRSSTVPSHHRKRRCVAAVLVVMLSARTLVVTNGLMTTSRSSADISLSANDQPASGDFLAMSDIGTGKEINNRNFRMARSEFADYCLNGDCVNGDVLKVVSKLAKRILSDPRILGLRTAVDDYEWTDVPEESRALRGTNSLKTRRVNSNRRNGNEASENGQKTSISNRRDLSSEEESPQVVKLDTTVNCYNAAPGGWDSLDVFYPDENYDELYGSGPDYAEIEEAKLAGTNANPNGGSTKIKESSARAIGETAGLFENSFTSRDDTYENDRYSQRYDQNRLNSRYRDKDSYQVMTGSDTSENPKAYRVPGKVRYGETHGSIPGLDESLDRGTTKYIPKNRDDDDDDGGQKGGGGGGGSYGGGGGYGGGSSYGGGGGYGGGSSYGGGGGYGGGYGGGSSYGYSGYDECCKNKLLPILLVGLLGLLGFFLYIRSTTLAAARSMDDNDLSDVLLDGPTWLSMVHELWEQDTVLENTICTQETLCRMNRLAMSAPGQAGWAVSLSSLPLSYLLHTRHVGGFTSYMDAAMMGRSGANCTELYSSCPRLSH